MDEVSTDQSPNLRLKEVDHQKRELLHQKKLIEKHARELQIVIKDAPYHDKCDCQNHKIEGKSAMVCSSQLICTVGKIPDHEYRDDEEGPLPNENEGVFVT